VPDSDPTERLTQRWAVQQALVSTFARFALESGNITATMARAVDLVTEVLDAPMSILAQVVGPDRATVLEVRGPLDVCRGDQVEVPRRYLSATESASAPVVVADWQTEGRFEQGAVARAAGIASSLNATVWVGGKAWGRLAVMYALPRRFCSAEVDFLDTVAHVLAAALERDWSERSQAALAGFGRCALESRDIDATVVRAVDLVAELLQAPIAALARGAGAGRHATAAGEQAVFRATMGARWDAAPVMIEDWHAQTRFPRPPALEAAGVVATLSLAVLGGGQPCRLGVHDVVPRRFTGAEMDVVQSIAHLLAAALERDLIESRLQEAAHQLQEVLLPAALPVLEGITTAARYVPAGGQHVGGDWYDVLALPRGGIALVIGDVEGHDRTAAALMGQIRHVLRAYAIDGHTPTETLARLNAFVAARTDRLVTCCYAELHPGESTVTVASAGHPPPVVLPRGGGAWTLPVPAGLMLGVQAEQTYVEVTSVLPPGCTLALVTDGLVDDRPGTIHRSLDALIEAAAGAAGEPLEVLADRLVTRPADGPALRDDAALLLVRLAATSHPGYHAVRVYTNTPAANTAARHLITDLLTSWNLPALCDPAALAVSELVTNVVLHTTSPIRLTLRRVGPARIRIGVHDTSDRIPSRPTPPAAVPDPDALEVGGRGLSIVDRLADTWGISPAPGLSGKTVWLELQDEPTHD
jgi:serine phosphatase RsbU (regulator of sigma subunit)/anti-sigma regulatory factor (Ser/Thr protein kinase)